MPKNKIQFQKGLSLHHFQELYGTEETHCRSMVGDLIYHSAQSKPIPQQQMKLAENWW